jgi:hypothetical protein
LEPQERHIAEPTGTATLGYGNSLEPQERHIAEPTGTATKKKAKETLASGSN